MHELGFPDFSELYFGMSDSKNEYAESAEEFAKSFVDLNGIINSVIDGKKTLILGPKGTGKSALAWYLHAEERELSIFTRIREASDLPLADIPQLTTGQPAGTERTVTAWKFIILCNFLELLLEDQSCDINNRSEVLRVTKLLKRYGLMGKATGKAILNISTTTVSIPIPKVGQIYKRESSTSLNIFSLLPYLEDWASTAISENKHILILDGLDSIFLNDNRYDESLASLVQASYSINQMLKRSNSAGSIVLLIRNDIFNRISLTLPDSQKMRDDFSFELDWRVYSGSVTKRAPLVRLVNQKAAHALEVDSVDVLGYFPDTIDLAVRSGNPYKKDTLTYLLNLTRHTPRDLLRLLEEIRKVYTSDTFRRPQSGMLSQEIIREGVHAYCSRYFIGAINNEFAGIEEGIKTASLALNALHTMGRAQFTYDDFYAEVNEHQEYSHPDTKKLLTRLFQAGAIGNLTPGSKNNYLRFYHRRDDAMIYFKGMFVLHNALTYAWGLQFQSGE